MIKCPACAETAKFFLGQMGSKTFYRCRACGTDYTRDFDDTSNQGGDIE